eukprot:CAMPEP_0174836346 /NCGR_PEP_ID=MMETSP1114-20130205/6007_1 /TAXON_ID=312471 /ORGANISM="Neobodo designis, Strain CCAP 1951/1" /LENGTH=60 /DNA_ID=CAMNT_0016070333 /DNA_START=30 /DNA_END=212 /DNA_ORIENTATION=+
MPTTSARSPFDMLHVSGGGAIASEPEVTGERVTADRFAVVDELGAAGCWRKAGASAPSPM